MFRQRIFALLCLAALAACTGSDAPSPIRVLDGDHVFIGGRVLQLEGIDAPELGQRCLVDEKLEPCGLEVAFALAKLIALEDVSCTVRGSTVRCEDGGGGSLARSLLEQGLALASGADETVGAIEADARESGTGIFRGTFTDPSQWRAGMRLPAEAADVQPCPIVRAGNRLYVPTDIDYSDAHGERFCTMEAALASGWPPAGPAAN